MASAKKTGRRVRPKADNSTDDSVPHSQGFAEAPQPALSGAPLKGPPVADWADEVAREVDAGLDAKGRRSADIPGKAPETGRRAVDQSIPLKAEPSSPSSSDLTRGPRDTAKKLGSPVKPENDSVEKRRKTTARKTASAKSARPKTTPLKTARGTSIGGPGTAKERAAGGLMPVAGLDVTLEDAGDLPQ